MANQTTEPTTAGPERIAFEVERLEQSDSGRVEVDGPLVRGPWPSLRPPDADAALSTAPSSATWPTSSRSRGRPRTARIGWRRSRSRPSLDRPPSRAVGGPGHRRELADGGRPASPRRRRPTAAILRAPRIRTDAGAPRPALTERAQEIDRLNSRLIAAGQALERERARARPPAAARARARPGGGGQRRGSSASAPAGPRSPRSWSRSAPRRCGSAPRWEAPGRAGPGPGRPGRRRRSDGRARRGQARAG